jgi:hypothetical protein
MSPCTDLYFRLKFTKYITLHNFRSAYKKIKNTIFGHKFDTIKHCSLKYITLFMHTSFFIFFSVFYICYLSSTTHSTHCSSITDHHHQQPRHSISLRPYHLPASSYFHHFGFTSMMPVMRETHHEECFTTRKREMQMFYFDKCALFSK